jgi:alpha-glucuronidase
MVMFLIGCPLVAHVSNMKWNGHERRTLLNNALLNMLATILLWSMLPPLAPAETGADAWLRYASLDTKTRTTYEHLPSRVVVLGDSAVLKSAQQELVRGLGGMTGRPLPIETKLTDNTFVLGTLAQLQFLAPNLHPTEQLIADGYWLKTIRIAEHDCLVITAATDSGVLYGVFAFLSKIAQGKTASDLDEINQPHAPLRWVNQWDNLDGSIERGYGGRSIFFAHGKVLDDLSRAGEYARLLASVGINGCDVNNVNANPHVLDVGFISQVRRIADAFRPWGVRLALSVNFSSPQALGDLDTFDPLDPQVVAWWRKKVDEIYRQIPDFGGFVVKADSEGRPGPSSYHRTHAEAANMLARALKPHGGVVFYRGFVYNHHLDWHNLKNDRAKDAYDNFHPLDGQFDDNAIVQIKNGPIDFQVREPASSLFAGLRHTNEAIELQITQEYTGQQRQLCFLVPMWKEVLDFDMHVEGDDLTSRAKAREKWGTQENAPTPVKEIVTGKTFHRPTGGFAGVANVGLDANWMGNPLAMANLYGFGRLAWDADLSSETIVDEWTRLTFGNDPLVVKTISTLQLSSWHVYESYTGPLGVGTLTFVTGNHYDPAPDSSERNGWGQWHRGDHDGIGMDRTMATGTGYIGQYPAGVQKMYETLAACPDELLLFFHHVSYQYVLHSGQAVVQYIYDSHYDGAERARDFVAQWKTLSGHVDDERYSAVLAMLQYQAQEAIVWRNTICNWIYTLSGIPDQKGRLGKSS